MSDVTENTGPNEIDIHVGRRVRQCRKAIGVTQEQLADGLGLTFQQVQKYERGANRVSASKLYQIAVRLGCGIDFFFEGLADPSTLGGTVAGSKLDTGADALINEFLMSPDGQEVAGNYLRLTTRSQKAIRNTIAAMAEDRAEQQNIPVAEESAPVTRLHAIPGGKT